MAPSEARGMGGSGEVASRKVSIEWDKHQVPIDILPDYILLEIFNFHANHWLARPNAWHTLVHVCRRWRAIVFAFPRHLGLRLQYTGTRHHIMEMPDLDIWPRLPIMIVARALPTQGIWNGDDGTSRAGNIVAMLNSEHHDRVCEIELRDIPRSLWEKVAASMQTPFPELTDLNVSVTRKNKNLALDTPEILRDSFLSGSAPRLRSFNLSGIPFPAMQKLLLSAGQLVHLSLGDIPHSGYISPEAMVTCLSALPKLKRLSISFRSPRSRPDPESRGLPPLTRSILPTLTSLYFHGAHEYLEDIMSRIDAPLVLRLKVTFFIDRIFIIPHFHRFISNTNINTLDKATVIFCDEWAEFIGSKPGSFTEIDLMLESREADQLLSSLAQICRSPSPPFSTLRHLYIEELRLCPPYWRDDTDSTQWSELLASFISLENLYLYKGIELRVRHALQELTGERVTEVLPALQRLFLQGFKPSVPVDRAIGQWLAARQASGHPVAVRGWIGRGVPVEI